MDVQSTVCHMMRVYPTLYPTRAMALASLFDSYPAAWRNGELVRLEPDDNSDSYLLYPPEELADPELSEDIREVLSKRRENAKAQFTYDNAYLLSRHTMSKFPRSMAVAFSGKRFDDIPNDVTPDWLEAAKELAHLILMHQFEANKGTSLDYLERQKADQERSRTRCLQFLERFQVITPSPVERAARLATLQREAQALGLELVDKNGKAVSAAD